jgi:hypothetical protein
MAAEHRQRFIDRVKEGVRRVTGATTGDTGSERVIAPHEIEADALDAAHHLEEDATSQPPSARSGSRMTHAERP